MGRYSQTLTRTRVAGFVAVAAMAVGAVGLAAGGASAAAAPVPSFPDNIVVFPDRDFVSIEGYSEYGGQTATLEVLRPGVGIVGSAEGVVSGGDVAFEVNHPGGYCWGAGTGLLVTPDIRPDDEVTLKIGGVALGTTTVLDVQASDGVLAADGVTMTVAGHIRAGIDPTMMEQRVIEAGLVDTPVAKRDIRALFGPLVTAPRGGYSSGLSVSGETFTATYVFDDSATAQVAVNAGLGERAMAWQLVDAAGNRQGLTIAEHGEAGGPGVGGCPNGPLQSGPPAPTTIVAARTSDSTIKVNWTPAVALPGTQPILGYRVTAVDTAVSGGEQVEIGRRINNPAATSTTITGLDPSRSYHVEVVSVSSVGQTFPAATAAATSDSVAPTISASSAGGSYPVPQQVTLTANEPGVDIYFTTNGSDPIDNAGGPTATATLYTGPVTVAASGTLTFAGFDPTGNPSAITTLSFVITNDPTAAKTAITSVTPLLESATVTWQAADPVSPATSITSYQVRVYDQASNGNVVQDITVPGAGTSLTINALTGNTNYWYTVAATNNINPAFGPESDRFGPVAPLGAVVANAGADQVNVARGTAAVPLSGAGSTAGATYLWTQATAADGSGTPTAANKMVIANPASMNTSFNLRQYTFDQTLSPLFFKLTVTKDGNTRTDVVKVTPRNDTVTIATAKWKAGDFRITGTGAIDGAIITVRGVLVPGGAVTNLGSVQVVAGAWDLRLRNAAAPAVRPPSVVAISTAGANVGPFTVS